MTPNYANLFMAELEEELHEDYHKKTVFVTSILEFMNKRNDSASWTIFEIYEILPQSGFGHKYFLA